MSLLEKNTTKKRQVNKNVRQIDFDIANNKGGEYKIKAI